MGKTVLSIFIAALRGMTMRIEEAAERVGVTSDTWEAWEAGTQIPGNRGTLKIATVFGVDALHLFALVDLALADTRSPVSPDPIADEATVPEL